MKSITVRDIDEQLDRMLRSKARTEGFSLNQTIKKILAEALGSYDCHKNGEKQDFSEFCGLWSEDDLSEFEKAAADFEQIYEGDWR